MYHSGEDWVPGALTKTMQIVLQHQESQVIQELSGRKWKTDSDSNIQLWSVESDEYFFRKGYLWIVTVLLFISSFKTIRYLSPLTKCPRITYSLLSLQLIINNFAIIVAAWGFLFVFHWCCLKKKKKSLKYSRKFGGIWGECVNNMVNNFTSGTLYESLLLP